jgi:hypothetical protein
MLLTVTKERKKNKFKVGTQPERKLTSIGTCSVDNSYKVPL